MKLCIYLLPNPNRKLTSQQSTCLRLYFLRYLYLYYGLSFLQNFLTKNNKNKTVHPLATYIPSRTRKPELGAKVPVSSSPHRKKYVSRGIQLTLQLKGQYFLQHFFYETKYRKLQTCTLVLSKTLESCKGTVDVLSMVEIIKLTVYASRKKISREKKRLRRKFSRR